MSRTKAAVRRRTARPKDTLVYYDGPQVLTLVGGRDSLWVCVAIDEEGFDYPIFCVHVLKSELERYMSGHVDLLYLFKYRKTLDYRIADLAKETRHGLRLEAVQPKSDWFPAEGFFSRDHTDDPSIEEDGAQPERTVVSVAIDGEWEFPELAAFSDGMSECYSFLYGLEVLGQKIISPPWGNAIRASFEAYPWKGGGSSLNFYSALYKLLPANDRLDVEKLKYASPGEIELRGNADIFSGLLGSIGALGQNYHKAGSAYYDLHTYLSKAKLLTASREEVRGNIETQKIVSGMVERLAQADGFDKTAVLYENCERNWIITAKLLMSYHRRFMKLFAFYAEGRASLAPERVEGIGVSASAGILTHSS